VVTLAARHPPIGSVKRSVAGLATLALLLWPAVRSAAQGDSASQAATPVIVAEVQQAPAIVSLPLTGSVVARRVSRVSSQVQGFISTLHADIGDSVDAGEELARLDDALERSAVQAATAAVKQAQARLDDAVRRRDEAVELVAEKNIAATQYQSLEAEVLQEAAGLEGLRAELARRREILARHSIRAPFAGVIARRLSEAGQWVQAGDPVVELHELDVVRVQTEVPQAWYSRVSIGTPARLVFDAYPDQPMDASVSIRVSVADSAARTFPVLLQLDNSARDLTPGMSVRVSLAVTGNGNGGDTLQLPRDALVRGPDGITRVWVVREDRSGALRGEPMAVRTGRSFGSRVEIVEGDIRLDDRVVVRGNESLRAGEPVRIVTEASGGR
jgi:membrane fusion protein (multidrug efflux system)